MHEVELPAREFHWNSTASLTEKIASSLRLGGTTPATPASRGVHAFTIVDRVLKDSQLQAEGHDPRNTFHPTLQNHGKAIADYAEQWSLNLANPGELERKIEELQWMTVTLYAVTGWSKEKPFHANFFL